ncbi:MAG: 3-(3-hydroxy-phenyl)propionate/3-hydroxycinnamic acid hydroxylase [Paracidovorax wautersii]|uniref:3-(3-hydroxy-phenyl)propionate/3-hydroxycinnamic acid hydroxylase n=1 Tax=Paracidovorax wautersii TaxID=1177982 RepID=A0A7V8FL03_9BURK|nr:MAG: 3-(3-hydroxy-phenyl)propionate/3-hydroxycinnamic acid hydroxylase [Paracidovorax wautersii]
MSPTLDLSSPYDVLVVGFGPSGAVAAAMLGQRGHRTLVIDRLAGIYDKPRAIALDHEIPRHFDNMGVMDEVLPHVTPFTASEHFGAQGQLIRRIDMVAPPYPLGYTPSMVFTQPPVEAALRRHVQGLSNVTVALQTELVDLVDEGDEVKATVRDATGHLRTVRARYVVGCDGASSTVRQLAGLQLTDLVFDEPWLVVDIRVHAHAQAKLPPVSAQFCDPARPTSYLVGPGNHRRWEIMLLPGEAPRDMEAPDRVWQLLAPWLTPEDGELWRAAAYRFHALVASRWRHGRVFIAGDAAHQQPPFIGQGMCQGLRDVANLAWKLDRVLRGQSSEALLDSYGVERQRHVQTLTGRIKAIGQTICERDPEAAAARDARILVEGGGQPLTITRQEIVPPLEAGLIAPPGTAARGLLFPQPFVVQGATRGLLDHVIGTGWRLILDGRALARAQVPVETEVFTDLTVVSVAPEEGPAMDPDAWRETDSVLAAWFDRHQAIAALVRPDHYVFGAAGDLPSLRQQLAQARAGLA